MKPDRIPYLFVAFFGVVFAANAVMIGLAVTTFSGLETQGAYEKGLAYNQTLEQAAVQEARGWTQAVALDARGLVLTVADAQGVPVRGAIAAARLVRPADAALDRTLPLTEVEPGRYAATLDLPAPGLWLVRSEVRAGAAVDYAARRLVVD